MKVKIGRDKHREQWQGDEVRHFTLSCQLPMFSGFAAPANVKISIFAGKPERGDEREYDRHKVSEKKILWVNREFSDIYQVRLNEIMEMVEEL